MKSLIILTLVVLAYSTERPIIGILTNPSDTKEYPSTDYSYFPASYVKWIESAGGLVVPIQWDSTYDEIDEILSKVNGVLFTGGDVDLYLNNTSPGYTFNKFTDTAAFILNKVILYNKAGHYYPLFGTCQGFQLLNYLASQFHEVLTAVDDDMGVQRKLILTQEPSSILGGINNDIVETLVNTDGPYYSHHWAVLPETYESIPSLKNFFKITALSQDGKGKTFIAMSEGIEVPIFAWQFHPEKHQFEYRSKATHDQTHIEYAVQMAIRVIELARLNTNTMSDEDLYQKVIYNYPTTMRMSVPSSSFAQQYYFHRVRVETRLDKKQLGIKSILGH